MAENYMSELGKSFERLNRIRVTDAAAEEYINALLPIDNNASAITEKNIIRQRNDLKRRYMYAPDLKCLNKNGYRFINAVSDFATHAKPIRETKKYKETLFNKTMEGNPLTDKAYKLLMTA